MKCIVMLTFVMVAVASVQSQGFPTKSCPPGEHSVLYCPQMDEPSCANPTVHAKTGPAACGIPDCFCNNPNVRNLKTGKCVKLSDC